MATTIKASVSFDIPAIISDPVLGFANVSNPQLLNERIAKLNITDAMFEFQEVGGTSFTVGGQVQLDGTGKIKVTVDLKVDSTYHVSVTLMFSDKPNATSSTVTVETNDETEYGEIAKKIFGRPAPGSPGSVNSDPLAGAVITITNPDGDDWTATSRAEDGLVYLQRIPVGSYSVASIVKEGYDTVIPSQPIVVTADGINWNQAMPVYTLFEVAATPTGV